jgi:hypothetical protein
MTSNNKIKEEFNITPTGAWSGEISQQHVHDKKLAQAITKFFKDKIVDTVLDLGAGLGLYTKELQNNQIFASCYDGHPETQILSEGRCAVIDLTKKISFSKYDWVLSLEVGEHLPKEYEDSFFQTLVNHSKKGVLLSWAIPGQGGDGHVNEQTNEYIKSKMFDFGYKVNLKAEEQLRASSTLSWFKKTIMVFEKEIEEVEVSGAYIDNNEI